MDCKEFGASFISTIAVIFVILLGIFLTLLISKILSKTILKGMSPDLFDNVILLCGGTIYDCYRILRDDAGIIRKKMQAEDMLTLLNVNGDDFVDTRIQRPRKIRNASEILNVLSTI